MPPELERELDEIIEGDIDWWKEIRQIEHDAYKLLAEIENDING